MINKIEMLKFKAFSTNKKGNRVCEIFDLGTSNKENDESPVIVRFTGLVGNKRKPIFEGDIISVPINKSKSIKEPAIRYDPMGNPVISEVETGRVELNGRSLYEVKWEQFGCRFTGRLIKHEPSSLGKYLDLGDLHLGYERGKKKMNVDVVGSIHDK
jgi:hypothetical protein